MNKKLGDTLALGNKWQNKSRGYIQRARRDTAGLGVSY